MVPPSGRTSAPRPAAPNKLGIRNAAELDRVEEALAKHASAMLRFDPIRGAFDAEHLKAIHKRLFGQIYDHAGQFRVPTSGWGKFRELSDGSKHFVGYHNLRGVDGEKAIEALTQRAAHELRHTAPSDTQRIASASARLYAELDHLHPFVEGNSRTLRTFVSQLVRETTGRRLEWDATNRGADRRDELYRARDVAVIARQLPLEQHEKQMRQLSRSAQALRGARSLESIMRENLEVGLQRDMALAMTHSPELARRVVEIARGRYAANFDLTGTKGERRAPEASITRGLER